MRLQWAVALLALLAGRYVFWRCTATLNLDSPLAAALSLLLLAAELWLLAHGFLQLLFTLAPAQRQAPASTDPKQADSQPWVDVLVPSYGEPIEVVERCLRGCRALNYGRFRLWLLDDSGRPELAELCKSLGCHYRSRERREHAKAGNLNHVLPELQGELIAVFDADVVPVRGFLERTVGLFDTAEVGLVQTPQTYMNADPVIRNLALERWLLPDEESFYRWIEPVRQRLGAVVCARTSFVLRRSALLAVGGFETGTPSEDLATGIRLTASGWRLLFVPEKLSAGLAPLTAAAFARQRCRWASGTLQTLRTGANPLLIKGLNPIQRLAFLEGILHWLNALPQLVLLLMPLSLGVLGIAPLRVSGAGLLQMALPLYGAQHKLGRPLPFRVTPKGLASGRQTNPEPRLLLPLLALLSLQLVALLNLLPIASRVRLDLLPESKATLALGVGWPLVNVLLLLAALRCCWDRPRSDAVPWLAWRESVQLAGQPSQLVALSEAGLELELEQAAPQPGQELELATSDGRRWLLRIEACRGRRLGCSWAPISNELAEERKEWLQQRLYRRDGQWPTRRAPAEPLALAAILTRLLRPLAAETWLERSLLPANPPNEQHGAVVAEMQR